MTPVLLTAREHHRFEAAGRPFVFLVPSASIFALDEAADAVVRLLAARARTRGELVRELADGDVDSTIDELIRMRVIGEVEPAPTPMPKIVPLPPFPLTTMVLKVTNECNLACTYGYEYSADKIVDTENGTQAKFMSAETARQSVDSMLKESGEKEVAHLTFFGGETLMN